MLAVNDLGEPCAGEPHARFDGRGLETEHPGQGSEEEQPSGKLFGSHGFAAYRQDLPPRQPPTLRGAWLGRAERAGCWLVGLVVAGGCGKSPGVAAVGRAFLRPVGSFVS